LVLFFDLLFFEPKKEKNIKIGNSLH